MKANNCEKCIYSLAFTHIQIKCIRHAPMSMDNIQRGVFPLMYKNERCGDGKWKNSDKSLRGVTEWR